MRKKTVFTIIAGLVFLISCGVTKSVSEKNAAIITGKWEIKNVTSSAVKNAEEQKMMDDILKEMLKDAYVTFGESKVYEAKITGQTKKGSWTVSEDGKQITVKTADGDTKILDISELSKEKLILEGKDNGNTVSMTLIRVK